MVICRNEIKFTNANAVTKPNLMKFLNYYCLYNKSSTSFSPEPHNMIDYIRRINLVYWINLKLILPALYSASLKCTPHFWRHYIFCWFEIIRSADRWKWTCEAISTINIFDDLLKKENKTISSGRDFSHTNVVFILLFYNKFILFVCVFSFVSHLKNSF